MVVVALRKIAPLKVHSLMIPRMKYIFFPITSEILKLPISFTSFLVEALKWLSFLIFELFKINEIHKIKQRIINT